MVNVVTVALPDPYPDETIHPYWVPESGQRVGVEGPDRVGIEMTARWRTVDAETARRWAEALLAAADEADRLVPQSFPCVVDDCPERFTSYELLNRHSRGIHMQTMNRYPGVTASGDFTWHTA